jgi:hypothetical protein
MPFWPLKVPIIFFAQSVNGGVKNSRNEKFRLYFLCKVGSIINETAGDGQTFDKEEHYAEKNIIGTT